MKKIFSVIGGFFARIWRWIKETAWVQPLLIVSLIFGIILLIQPISQGITTLADKISKRERLYENNKVTLYDGKAYDLIYDEDAKFEKDDKYFLMFVQKECSACYSAYEGFETLFKKSNLFKSEPVLKTIYVDEEGDDVNPMEKGLMYDLFYRPTDEVYDFHDAIYNVAKMSEYWETRADDEEMGFLDAIHDWEDLNTPLILLMDKETYEADKSTFGIKEVMFGVKGWAGTNDGTDKAITLDRMWLSSWGSGSSY